MSMKVNARHGLTLQQALNETVESFVSDKVCIMVKPSPKATEQLRFSLKDEACICPEDSVPEGFEEFWPLDLVEKYRLKGRSEKDVLEFINVGIVPFR